MQAIVTKYLGPTNRRGPRVKATAQAGSLTFDRYRVKNRDANRDAAASTLCVKLGWFGGWYRGQLPDGNNVYVCHDRLADDLAFFIVEKGKAIE